MESHTSVCTSLIAVSVPQHSVLSPHGWGVARITRGVALVRIAIWPGDRGQRRFFDAARIRVALRSSAIASLRVAVQAFTGLNSGRSS